MHLLTVIFFFTLFLHRTSIFGVEHNLKAIKKLATEKPARVHEASLYRHAELFGPLTQHELQAHTNCAGMKGRVEEAAQDTWGARRTVPIWALASSAGVLQGYGCSRREHIEAGGESKDALGRSGHVHNEPSELSHAGIEPVDFYAQHLNHNHLDAAWPRRPWGKGVLVDGCTIEGLEALGILLVQRSFR